MAIQRRKSSKKPGGRRANYAPAGQETGSRKYVPVGWANWLGLVLFSLVGIALLAETINAVREDRGNDPIAAGVLTVAFAVMVYFFATTRMKD